ALAGQPIPDIDDAESRKLVCHGAVVTPELQGCNCHLILFAHRRGRPAGGELDTVDSAKLILPESAGVGASLCQECDATQHNNNYEFYHFSSPPIIPGPLYRVHLIA